MRPKHLTYAPTATDDDGICSSQTSVAAADFTIGGALATAGVATLDIPRHVTVTAVEGDESALTFTITGTDRYGATITEDISGSNLSITKGTKNFKTVTTVHVDGATAGKIDVGSADAFESQVIPVGRFMVLSHAVRMSSGAHFTHNTQYTVENPFEAGFDEYTANWETSGGEQTANYSGKIEFPVAAIRLAVTDYVDGSVASFDIVQV